MSELPTGGSFLWSETKPDDVYVCEEFTSEHKMIFKMVKDFVAKEILTKRTEIESKNHEVVMEIVKKLGDLGLIGTGIPEEYGGSDLDKISTYICAENMGRTGSFKVVYAGITGIGTLSVAYFGNEAQKNGIVRELVAGDKIMAFALTESGAGTDAMALKTTAVLSPDGKKYIINGTKQFITDSAIADYFCVFCKTDGKITAIIVEKGTPGFEIGPEEHKMVVRGSSTCPLFFDNVEVPVENVVHEVGRGHETAFNLLNLGRVTVATSALGVMKYALEESARYGNERKQFGVPIASFGMIKEKLAEMAIKTYVLESAVYRCVGLLDRVFNTMDKTRLGQEIAHKLPEYALECSITKLFGSEISANIVDEAVQIHGGYGLLEDYPVEGLYRDARSSRILEGTSEVNRIIICKTILRALKNESLPLSAKINELRANLKKRENIVRQNEVELVTAAKEAFLFTLSVADEKLGDNLKNTQEILGRLTNIAIEVFAIDSALVRTQKVRAMAGENKAELKAMMAKAYIYTAMPALEKNAAEVMASICETEEAVENINVIKSILKHVPQNVMALRTEIAKAVSNEEKYPV